MAKIKVKKIELNYNSNKAVDEIKLIWGYSRTQLLNVMKTTNNKFSIEAVAYLFAKQVSKLKRISLIKSKWDNELSNIKQLADNDKTILKYISEYRKSIKTYTNTEQSELLLKYIIADKSIKQSVIKSDEKKISKRMKSKKSNVNAEKIILRAITYLQSHNIYEVVSSLILLTGRRETEILKTGIFEASENKNYIVFSGQLKTKGTGDNVKFEIPIFCAPELIINAIDKIRTKIDTTKITNKKVNSLYAKSVNSATDRVFSSAKYMNRNYNSLTPHKLRNIYACFCAEIKNRTIYSDYTVNLAVATILGHKAGQELTAKDLESANHYTDFEVSDKDFLHSIFK